MPDQFVTHYRGARYSPGGERRERADAPAEASRWGVHIHEAMACDREHVARRLAGLGLQVEEFTVTRRIGHYDADLVVTGPTPPGADVVAAATESPLWVSVEPVKPAA